MQQSQGDTAYCEFEFVLNFLLTKTLLTDGLSILTETGEKFAVALFPHIFNAVRSHQRLFLFRPIYRLHLPLQSLSERFSSPLIVYLSIFIYFAR